MPDYSAILEIIPRGNDRDYKWTVQPILTADPVIDAYMRVNSATTPFGQVFEKHITSTLTAGQGHIEDDGAISGIAILRFQVTATNTLLLAGGTPSAPTNHTYGVEIRTAAGKIDEFEQGMLPVIEQVVVAA